MGVMDWHARFTQQARWTAQLRAYLFKKVSLDTAHRILDLGCGTGALLEEFPGKMGIYGLDLSLPAVNQAAYHAPGASLACADAETTPFASATFDIVFCHFVLLWVRDPLKIVTEMRRVTRPGGAVLALAEPDYGARIDYPPELARLGRWQTESLQRQGADPFIGRKLAGIFARAGLKQIETGVLGGEWKNPFSTDQRDLEWDVLESDLAGIVTPQDIQKMRKLDDRARECGERVLYVPTFYALGIV